ncbi:MAG: glycosyltransferase family 39 protein [Pseudomonadota bacterium]
MSMYTNAGVTRTLQDVALIFCLSLLGLLWLIANPGYYSHDELQKLDHVVRYGFQEYLKAYVVIVQGSEFGTPVRPFAFFIQGVLALGMRDFPFLVHLFDVLTHAAVAALVYLALRRFAVERRVALVAAAGFALSPMAVIAAGWSAALMDRWYVLFGLLALLAVERFLSGTQQKRYLVLLFLWASLAILSKETAIMLAGTMMIFILIRPQILRERKFWVALAVFALPALLYLLYRLPAIVSSFGNPAGGAYKASTGNLPEGIVLYLAYPFLYSVTEAINWVFVPKFWVGVAVAANLAIPLLLWRLKSARFALGYVFFYFLFLLPVLLIPNRGAHYLYGSSIVVCVALACLLCDRASWFSPHRIAALGLAAVLLVHTVYLQVFVYSIGSCMDSAMTGVEASYLGIDRPSALELRAEPGAPGHVLHRFTTGREQIGENYPVKMTVAEWDAPSDGATPVLIMDRQCRVFARLAPKR